MKPVLILAFFMAVVFLMLTIDTEQLLIDDSAYNAPISVSFSRGHYIMPRI